LPKLQLQMHIAQSKCLSSEDVHIIGCPSLVLANVVELQTALAAIIDLDNKSAIESAMGCFGDPAAKAHGMSGQTLD
jgi:hypothetical protein